MIATVNTNMVESALNKINKLHFFAGIGSCGKESLLQEVELLINVVIQVVDGLLRNWIHVKFGLGELVGFGF